MADNREISVVGGIYVKYEIDWGKVARKQQSLLDFFKSKTGDIIAKYHIMSWIARSGYECTQVLVGFKSTWKFSANSILQLLTFDNTSPIEFTPVPIEVWGIFLDRMISTTEQTAPKNITTLSNAVDKPTMAQHLSSPLPKRQNSPPRSKDSECWKQASKFGVVSDDSEHNSPRSKPFEHNSPRSKPFEHNSPPRRQDFDLSSRTSVIRKPFFTKRLDESEEFEGRMVQLVYTGCKFVDVIRTFVEGKELLESYSIMLNSDKKTVHVILRFCKILRLKQNALDISDFRPEWIPISDLNHFDNAMAGHRKRSIPIVDRCNEKCIQEVECNIDRFENIYL